VLLLELLTTPELLLDLPGPLLNSSSIGPAEKETNHTSAFIFHPFDLVLIVANNDSTLVGEWHARARWG